MWYLPGIDFMEWKAYTKIMATSMMRKAKGNHSFQVQPYLDTAGVARKIVEFPKGRAIFIQGDPCNTVLYVQEGAVKLMVINESGKEAVIALLGAGDFLGEGCISGGSPVRLATATAMAPTTALVIEKKEMIRVLHEEKEFADRFISYMLKRNVKIEADLVDQLFNSCEKRLARAAVAGPLWQGWAARNGHFQNIAGNFGRIGGDHPQPRQLFHE